MNKNVNINYGSLQNAVHYNMVLYSQHWNILLAYNRKEHLKSKTEIHAADWKISDQKAMMINLWTI